MFSLTTFLIQIGVILVAARALGWVFRKFKQPQVVGEMLAGILLGPSLLGSLAPSLSTALFPPPSLNYLNAMSQVGLVLFMFLVGLELNPNVMRGRTHAAVATSHVSILAPFFLGTSLALFLYPRLSDASVPFSSFALFMGVSMSITAFPVLARILREHKMLNTAVGTVTIACAAVDDVTAWCILAGVVLLVRASTVSMPLWMTLLGTIAFASGLWLIGRKWLARVEAAYRRSHALTQDLLALILLIVLAAACLTEALGIHPLFGAFLVGAIMPKEHEFVHAITAKLEDLVVVLLLPIYFAITGLRMNVGMIAGSPERVLFFGLIMLVAIVGKFGGATIAARISGVPWREAGSIGVLMNTRGLVELVALNIGLDIGVISPVLFTMMVFMALITTFMTTPILEWIYPARLRQEVPLTPGQHLERVTLPARASGD